jgi:hypothetical protein
MRKTMSSNTWMASVCCALLVLGAASAEATVTVYTNRAQWEAGLNNLACEDFEVEVVGNHQTPFTTLNGTSITSVSGPGIPIEVLSNGIFNGSRELHFRDFGTGVKFATSLVGTVAFGFDYYASDGPGAHNPNLPWVLAAPGGSTSLAAGLPSFIGYIDNQGTLPSFTLTGPPGAQGGLSIDNLCVAKATPPPSTCIQPPNTTMVAWYPFDETSGTVSANLATANNGVQIGSPTPIAGQVGGALRFNGTSSYVEAPSSIVTNIGPADGPPFCSGSYSTCQGNFSIDVWIRLDPSASSDFVVIIDKRGGSAPSINGYHFGVYYGTLLLQLADGVGSGYSNYLSPVLTPSLTDGNWHLIAVTVQRASTSGISWYHNGVAIGTSDPTDRMGSLQNNSPLRIGTRTADSALSGWFHGDLDELEIFNRVLTPQEVFAIFQAGTFGKCK